MNNTIPLRLVPFSTQFLVRKPFIFLLLIAMVLVIFYPAIFGEIIKLDDVYLIRNLSNIKSWDLIGTFHPNGPGGIYYRPVTMVTYYLDKDLFGLDPGFMKLENIFQHIINAFLVYWLAYQLLPENKRKQSRVPFVSALFFGFHPVNTESVNWISGRTDVLACTFILLSANFIVRFKHTYKYHFIGVSSLFLALGFLSKETALSFLPGAVLMLFSHAGSTVDITERPAESFRRNDCAGNVSLFGILAAVILFVALRLSAFTSNTTRFGLTLSIIASDIPVSTFVVLNALAFYLKKLYFPLPLNFAIIEPDPLYDFFGLPIIIFSLYLLLKKRTMVAAVFLAGVFLIAPAFLVAFKQIAWTAYAERYVYMSSAFIVVASVISVDSLLNKIRLHIALKTVFVLTLLVLAGTATYGRSAIWKYNLTLFQDTIEKSPNYSIVRTLYGFSLVERGDYKNARIQFERAKKQEDHRLMFSHASPEINELLGYAPDADLGIAYLLEREGKAAEAVAAYERILRNTNGKFGLALKRLIPLLMDLIVESRRPSQINLYRNKLLNYTREKFEYEDAEVLYWAGKSLLVRGDHQGARELFTRAYERSDDSDKFKESIKKIIGRLDGRCAALIS